jgi:hypothetical protein
LSSQTPRRSSSPSTIRSATRIRDPTCEYLEDYKDDPVFHEAYRRMNEAGKGGYNVCAEFASAFLNVWHTGRIHWWSGPAEWTSSSWPTYLAGDWHDGSQIHVYRGGEIRLDSEDWINALIHEAGHAAGYSSPDLHVEKCGGSVDW